jgi:tRNA pseudouridine13 synthase
MSTHAANTEDTTSGKADKDDVAAKTETAITQNGNSNNEKSKETCNTEDDVEQSLGILEYLSGSTQDGFSAVVKARYSDFLVHEVDLEGNVARLTSMEIPESFKEEQPTEKVEEKTEKSGDETLATSDESLETQLTKMINNADVAKNVIIMLEAHDKAEAIDDNKEVDKFVTLPSLEKAERKAIHEWIRAKLPTARTDTADGKIRIWHVKFEQEMPNYKQFGPTHTNKGNRQTKRQKQSWPKDRPDYLKFVLYKENIDTTTATRDLSRRGSRARIGYAGMKDKRGITAQFCTLYRTTPQEIVTGRNSFLIESGGGGNTKQRGYSVVRIGNFDYVPNELRLGMLQGNRFDIIMRKVEVPQAETIKAQRQVLEHAAQCMKDRGFINYFGTQRFGKFNDTHLVGISVLKGDFKKAIQTLMEPKTDERPDITQARLQWAERFKNGETKENEATAAKQVLKRMNRFMTGEIAILESLARNPMDYNQAFERIPVNLRKIFLHAVQSLIWNRATSYRIANMDRDNAVVGDLVYGDGKDGSSKVHTITKEDVANKKYTIEDVLVPMVGKRTRFPTNELGRFIEKLLSDIGISHEMFKETSNNRALIVNGDYRKVICHPKDFDYTITEYFDPLQPLLPTDLMKIQGEEISIRPQQRDDECAKLAMIVGFTLPSSSYATIALRELMKRPTSNEFQKELSLE